MNAAVLEPKRSKRRKAIWLIPLLGFMLLLAPVVLFAGAGNPPCPGPGAATPNATTPAGGPAPGGMFAQPLKLQPGKWYEVGATDYGGPSDPTATNSGSITDARPELPARAPRHVRRAVACSTATPPTAGDVHVRRRQRAEQPAVHDRADRRQQRHQEGPLQARHRLRPGPRPVHRKRPALPRRRVVAIRRRARRLKERGQDRARAAARDRRRARRDATAGAPGAAGPNAVCDQLAATGTLQLTPGQRARILADGNAAAPASAPRAVKLAIAAANQIHTKPYSLIPGTPCTTGRCRRCGPPMTARAPSPTSSTRPGCTACNADVSGTLESWGQPGPGKWITVYANSDHTFIVIAGLAFDTADYGGPNIPAGSGPRWRQNPLGNLQDGLSYVVRHPAGL